MKNFEPKKGEFEKLEQKKKILQNSIKINENLNEIINNFIREDPPGIEKLFAKNFNNAQSNSRTFRSNNYN